MLNEEEETVSVRRLPDSDLSTRELRISCPDATGLGVDVMRVCLDFGLRIMRADISTDGDWCFLVLTVALSSGVPPRWGLLKSRLEAITPDGTDALRQLWRLRTIPKEQRPFLVHVSGYDRQGMLHALTHALWEADTSVFKAHIITTPAGEVQDTFWVFDNRDELPEAHRVLEICDRVKGTLGPDALCTVTAAPREGGSGGGRGGEADGEAAAMRMPCKDAVSTANLRAIVGRKKGASSAALCDMDDQAAVGSPLTPGSAAAAADVGVDIDNATSTSYTLITLRCRDRKGLLYDLFRSLKEVDLRVAYGRVEVEPATGACEAELFVQDAEGARISDPELLRELTGRLREAAALPVRIELRDALEGAASELTVAANVEPGGRGRPRVTFDVTQGLSAAGVGVFKADVYVDSDSQEDEEEEGREPSAGYHRPKEMHRFLISLPDGGAVASEQDKRALLEVVKSCLLGTRPAGAPPPQWARPAQGAAAASTLGAGRSLSLPPQQPPPPPPPPPAGLVRTLSTRWKGL